jgi:hypothetical protein
MLTISEATGFFASALVLLTFTMKDMRMLRIIAIFSNFAFISYGAFDWLLPVLSLHLLLLPLNLLRLKEIQNRADDKPTAHRELVSQPQLTLRSGCSRHFLDWDEGSRRPRHRCGGQSIRQIHSSALAVGALCKLRGRTQYQPSLPHA